MRVVTWNVNGLRAALRERALQWMVDELQPHILCLQETRVDLEKAKDTMQGLLEVVTPRGEERAVYYSTNPQEAHRAGVAICGPSEWLTPAPTRDDWLYGDEGRVQSVEVQGVFTLLCIYAPNTGREGRVGYKTQFLERLGAEVAWLRKTGHTVVLAGDFNVIQEEIDVHDWRGTFGHAGNREEERDEYLAFLRRRNTNHVDAWRESRPGERQYTWWDMRTAGRQRGRGWRIDTFIVDTALVPLVAECTIHDNIHGSDHCPVSLDIE